MQYATWYTRLVLMYGYLFVHQTAFFTNLYLSFGSANQQLSVSAWITFLGQHHFLRLPTCKTNHKFLGFPHCLITAASPLYKSAEIYCFGTCRMPCTGSCLPTTVWVQYEGFASWSPRNHNQILVVALLDPFYHAFCFFLFFFKLRNRKSDFF